MKWHEITSAVEDVASDRIRKTYPPDNDYGSGLYGEAGLRAAAEAGASEMCWGSGLAPKGFENKQPAEGGTMYHAIPSEEPQRIVRMSRDRRI